MFLIGIAGKKQHGKDTLSKIIVEETNKLHPSTIVKTLHFADALKDFLIRTGLCNRKQCYGTEADKNTLTPVMWRNLPKEVQDNYPSTKRRGDFLTGRQVMQIFGTDVMRKMFYDDIWVSTLVRDAKTLDKEFEGGARPLVVIVPDTRFKNEVKIIKNNNGKVLHITRTNYDDGTDTHASENDITSQDCSFAASAVNTDQLTIIARKVILMYPGFREKK